MSFTYLLHLVNFQHNCNNYISDFHIATEYIKYPLWYQIGIDQSDIKQFSSSIPFILQIYVTWIKVQNFKLICKFVIWSRTV